ncbi:MAG TPA: pitrilysin family protein [Fimbriimonadaceae bacterium]|nr:pitrilysin family protein [Fimbriimonadaceae bacterium]
MRIRTILGAAVLALASLSFGQDVKYEKYVLANGMTVILHEDHSLPVATVNIWYHVGSKDEPPDRSGFAHLFEHLMFMGTERAPKSDFDNIMEAGGGNNNASTTQDRTNFFDYGPSGLLPTLLWLEADRLEDLGRMMDQKKLDLQREVVKNERRENYENAPYGLVPLKIDEAMYPESHPYHIDTIGLPADLDAATVEDVKDFFATYYLPNNATMVVAGDFDPKTIKPLIDKLFGTILRGNDPIHKTAPEPALHEVKRLTLVDKVAQGRTYMVWHSPPNFKPGDGEMDLIAGMLGDGLESRLYQRLVVKDQIAGDVTAEQDSQYLDSLFMIVATAREGVPLAKVEADIDDELAKFEKNGPTESELGREKAKYEFATLNSLQNLSDVADQMNRYDFFLGEPNSFKWDLERHTKATATDVQTWAKKVLDPNARLILRVVPEMEPPDKNPRDERPTILPEKEFQPPTPEPFTLSNGLKGFYFRRAALPLMTVSLFFNGGAASDPTDKPGLASLTAGMLKQGADGLDAEGFAKAMDALGAFFSVGVDEVSSTADLYSTAATFDKALALYADAIIRPKLDEKDFGRQQTLRLDELAQDADDAETTARLVAMREYFGASHPYGRNPSGTPDSVKAITDEDIRHEHDALFRPDRATIFAAGNLPIEQVKASLEKQLGSWKAPAVPVPASPAFPAVSHNGLRVVIVDKPEAVQTVIRFVFPGVPYGNPDRIDLDALSTLLGGTFTSRLNANLREAKGYTYGAGAHSVFEPSLGYMAAASAVRADVTGASLHEFLSEFSRLRTGDVQEVEAVKARASMRTDIISSIGTLGGLVGTAESLYENGATMADLSRDLESLAGLTAAKLNPFAKQAAPLDNAVLVLVGDKDLILKQIADLHLPEPVFVPGIK